jgi:hypothetical protein
MALNGAEGYTFRNRKSGKFQVLGMNRFKLTCRFVFGVIAVVMLMSVHTVAQNAGVVVKGVVSETVSLSVPQILPNTFSTDVVSTGNRVDLTFSGVNKGGVIRLPLLVRSNSGFKISAILESKSAVVTQVAVTSVQATGTLVSRQAVRDINIERGFDARGFEDRVAFDSNGFEFSKSLLLLSGPRISLGGTLNSPGNALEIVLLIRLKSESGPPVSARLTLLATPESRIP